MAVTVKQLETYLQAEDVDTVKNSESVIQAVHTLSTRFYQNMAANLCKAFPCKPLQLPERNFLRTLDLGDLCQ